MRLPILIMRKTIAEYLSAVMEKNDLDLLLAAVGDVAKARGMAKIARDSGLGRESLYKGFRAGSKTPLRYGHESASSPGAQAACRTGALIHKSS